MGGSLLVKSRTILTVTIRGTQVWLVYTSVQKYFGEVYRVFDAPPLSGGASQNGWAYRDVPNAINRAMPDPAEGDAAVGQWITGGGCRAGWDIWVNGQQVCHGNTIM